MNFGFAIVNALVIGKVILVGEMMHLGRGYEKRPLWQSVLLKSVVFSVLVLVFHIVEEMVKRIIHGQPRGTVWHHGGAVAGCVLRVYSSVWVQGVSPSAG